MTAREPGVFHIGEILTVATGTFVSPTGIDGVYELIDYVTGERHMTHQLPRAGREITPHLMAQFPWIEEITIPPINGRSEGYAFLNEVAGRYGEQHVVQPLPFGAYVGREPIAEARELAPQAIIIGKSEPEAGAL